MVVSEETGFISLVIDGIINSDVTEAKLKTTMYRALIPMDETRQNNSLPVIGTWFKRREGKAAKNRCLAALRWECIHCVLGGVI